MTTAPGPHPNSHHPGPPAVQHSTLHGFTQCSTASAQLNSNKTTSQRSTALQLDRSCSAFKSFQDHHSFSSDNSSANTQQRINSAQLQQQQIERSRMKQQQLQPSNHRHDKRSPTENKTNTNQHQTPWGGEDRHRRSEPLARTENIMMSNEPQRSERK